MEFPALEGTRKDHRVWLQLHPVVLGGAAPCAAPLWSTAHGKSVCSRSSGVSAQAPGSGCVPQGLCSAGCQEPWAPQWRHWQELQCAACWWLQRRACVAQEGCALPRLVPMSWQELKAPEAAASPEYKSSSRSVQHGCPSTAEEPSLQQTCARAHRPAAHGLSMHSHARAVPRVPLSPWGGMDVREDVFGTEKVLINPGVMFWAMLVLQQLWE